MMFNKDCDLIFEAYNNDILEEMPVGFGSRKDDPEDVIAGEFDPKAVSQLDKYLSVTGRGLSPEAKKDIIVKQIIAVKEFLKDQEEDSEFTGGTLKQFYMGLLKTMVVAGGIDDAGKPYVNLANAKYRARVITKQMSLLDVLAVNKRGQVVVKDVDEKEPAIDKVVADTMEDKGPEQPREPAKPGGGIDLAGQFTIGKDLPANATPHAKEALQGLLKDLGASEITTHSGSDIRRSIVRNTSLNLAEATEAMKELIAANVINIKEKEHKGDLTDVRDIDVEDPRYAAQDYADKHFGDLGGGPMDEY